MPRQSLKNAPIRWQKKGNTEKQRRRILQLLELAHSMQSDDLARTLSLDRSKTNALLRQMRKAGLVTRFLDESRKHFNVRYRINELGLAYLKKYPPLTK